MSKYFLTKAEALAKLGVSGGDNFYITKAELLQNGADPSLLTKYNDTDFVVDDDIQVVVPITYKTIFSFTGNSYSDNRQSLSQTFDMTKSFRITGTFKINNVIWSAGGIFHIYNGSNDANYNYGLLVTAEAFNQSGNTPYLSIQTRKIDNTISTFQMIPVQLNVNYNLNIEYDSKNKIIKVKINDYEASDLIDTTDNKTYNYIMLSGHPRWSNGDCYVTYTNLKVELEE